MLPPDSVEMLGEFRDLIGQVVKMQKNLDANVTSIKKFINDGRETVVAARNDFPPYKLFHGETNYTLPDLSASDYSMESVLNMTSECESHECFQAAVQYLDDNFVDLIYHVGAAQLDMDTSMEIRMGREQLFVALYALTAIAGVLGLVGTCIAGNTGGAAADASKSSRLCHCTGLIFRMFSTWVLTIMAMFFLLLAALLMPSSILLSDMCGGLESTIITLVEADDKLGLSSPTITLRNASQLARYADLVPFGNFSQNFNFKFEPLVVPGVGPFVKTYFQECGNVDRYMNGTVVGAVDYTSRLTANATLTLVDFGVEQIESLGGRIQPGLGEHIDKFKGIVREGVPGAFLGVQKMVECERVNAAYFEVKAAFCCEFVIMLWWMALSSAVIGCCGCWSTCAIGCTANLKHRSEGEGDDVLAEFDEFDEFDEILAKPPVLPARRAGAPSGSKEVAIEYGSSSDDEASAEAARRTAGP